MIFHGGSDDGVDEERDAASHVKEAKSRPSRAPNADGGADYKSRQINDYGDEEVEESIALDFVRRHDEAEESPADYAPAVAHDHQVLDQRPCPRFLAA